MDDIKNVYKSLTNVDIDVQRRIWDERGRGYYGEYLLFSKLYQFLPGNGKILMNLNIPISADKTTEIDLLLIHETGLYVFEIKHYKGIYLVLSVRAIPYTSVSAYMVAANVTASLVSGSSFCSEAEKYEAKDVIYSLFISST